jgi:CheY-like chemotaxis protein
MSAKPVKPVRPSAIQPAEDAARRALIVDDNRASAAVSATLIEANGWAFDVARDGFEAVTRLREGGYSTVLLDYRLPGMDGVEVMTWIRRNLVPQPKVIVLSADPMATLDNRFAGLGVSAILNKPVTAKDLCRAMEG